MSRSNVIGLVKETFAHWYEDNTFRLGAALAYYTVFSIGPVVLIVISIASLLFGEEAARGKIVDEIGHAVGPRVGKAIEDILAYNAETGSGIWATVIGGVLLVVGATTVFAQLQDALNTIWGVKPKEGRGVWGVIRDRLLSFGMVLVLGFLLVVSLVVSTALSALTGYFVPEDVAWAAYLGQAVNLVVSLGVFTVMFAALYKLLPDVKIAWSDVWVGALVTAVLFTVGKWLIGLYLGQSSWIDAYGAAGSLVVILLWVYYSSQIILFGAEFTQVWADRSGRGVTPSANAEPLTADALARQGMGRRPIPAAGAEAGSRA